MKKTILSIILLLAVAGVAFYFGMVSRLIPDDSIGIVFTKTGGWYDEPVYPGHIRWMPSALLPTNLTIHTIPDETYTFSLDVSGILPNSGTYLEYLDQNADFSWSINSSISVKYDPEKLPNLFAETGFRPQVAAERINSDIQNLNAIIKAIYMERFSSADGMFTKPSIENIALEIRTALKDNFPYITILSLTVTNAAFPDFELYSRARSHYLAVLSNRTDKLITDIQVSAETKSKQTIKLEMLKRYGELFTQYPELIQFLAIDSPNANKLLPEDWY